MTHASPFRNILLGSEKHDMHSTAQPTTARKQVTPQPENEAEQRQPKPGKKCHATARKQVTPQTGNK